MQRDDDKKQAQQDERKLERERQRDIPTREERKPDPRYHNRQMKPGKGRGYETR